MLLNNEQNLSKLTGAHEKVLHQTHITADEPGSILRNFETLLTFVGETSPRLTGTHLLPLKMLRPLNEQMAQPIPMGLTRPQQKSFPHINGLYLLLRTSGLTQVEPMGKSARLRLDDELVAQWQNFNPVERYFTLLETWLLRGNPAVIGERESSFLFMHPFSRWVAFWPRIPKGGLAVDDGVLEDLRYTPAFHNLALQELFGMVEVEHPSEEVEGEGWRPRTLRRTPLGDATLALLFRYYADYENQEALEHIAQIPSGELQPLFAPYFPEWQENLKFSENEFREGVHVFRVTLQSGLFYRFKNLWRTIAIRGQDTLDDLSRAILRAYTFDNDHLHAFTYTSRFGSQERVMHSYMEEDPATDEVRVGDLPLQVGHTMEYLFDFGDSWRFDVTLERMEPPDPKLRSPQLLEAHGDAPPQYSTYEEYEEEDE